MSITLWALATAALVLGAGAVVQQAGEEDPLPSWNEGATKAALLRFIQQATTPGAPTFVPQADRVATFDNDGTLWVEHPMYVQGAFVFDRIRTLAPQHPEWKNQQPFKAVLENDSKTLMSLSEHQLAELLAITHSGMTTEAFASTVREWLKTAKHPRFNRLYKDLAYQPMLELMAHLRASGFSVFIVSGGGIDFMRVFAQSLYGVPPDQVVGSSSKLDFVLKNQHAELVKLPQLANLDDGVGKPVNIHLHIGKRPVFAAGNSDGDLQMLQYAVGGDRPGFALLIHHDDAEREYAYDSQTKVGQLKVASEEARKREWPVVSMKRDWKRLWR